MKNSNNSNNKNKGKTKNSPTRKSWEDRIRQLQSFRDTYGHVRVQTTLHEAKYPGLSTWIRQVRRTYQQEIQRQQQQQGVNQDTGSNIMGGDDGENSTIITSNTIYNNNNAKEWLKRQTKMEKLQQFLDIVNGPPSDHHNPQYGSNHFIPTHNSFIWNVNEHSWNVRYEQLRLFHQTHGHCRVPNNDVQYPGLGIWVRNQRREYRKLLLSQQQQQQQQEEQEEQECETEVKEDEQLGSLRMSTGQMKPTKSTLTPERLQQLQQLNFEWYKSHASTWENQYQRLLQFYHLNNHTNVPQNYCGMSRNNDTASLGKWCMNQRTAYKNQKRWSNSTNASNGNSNALTPERIQLLESIHFQWNIKSMKWKTMLQRLRQYYDTHDQSVTIHVNDTDHTDLRIWMNLQRYYYHNTITANKHNNKTETKTRNRRQGTTRSRSQLPSRQLPIRTLSASRIQRMERTIPNFQWTIRGSKNNGPSSEDWFLLFEEMRKKGIGPNVRPKQHWFEGINIQNIPIKDTPYTEQELLALWNQEDDDDDDNDSGESEADHER
jgi:Helicase associated domain